MAGPGPRKVLAGMCEPRRRNDDDLIVRADRDEVGRLVDVQRSWQAWSTLTYQIHMRSGVSIKAFVPGRAAGAAVLASRFVR